MAGIDIVFGILDTVVFILKWFWWVIVAGTLFFFKYKWGKWPIDVVIIEKRQDNLIKTNDRAGLFLDPYTQLTSYRLLKAKDKIPVPEYDYIIHNNTQNTNVLEKLINFLRGNTGTLFFFKYGSKQYKPVKVKLNSGDIKVKYMPIKNSKGEEIVMPIYTPLDPRKQFKLLDFEVVDWDNMNFMVQEQRASNERRSKKGDWIKQIAVPLAIIGATVIFSIIMIKFGFDFAVDLKNTGPTPPSTPADNPIIDIIPGG